MIPDKDLGMVETHPEIEIGHGQGEEINIEVILDKGTERAAPDAANVDMSMRSTRWGIRGVLVCNFTHYL